MPTNIEVVTLQLTDAQQKVARKLALRDSKLTASQYAAKLFGGRLKSEMLVYKKNIGKTAGERYDMAVAGGFAPQAQEDGKTMPRAEYVRLAEAECAELYASLV